LGTVSQLKRRSHQEQATSPQRYVRVTRQDHRGYVEFQFSIGDPSLYLEMTLPPEAFTELCREHAVRHLSDEEARRVDAAEDIWRYGVASEEKTDVD